MNLMRIRVLIKVGVFIFIVCQSQFLEFTHQVRKVVIRTVRVTCLPLLTSIMNLGLLRIGVELQNESKKTDWHEHESENSSKLVEPHVLWKMGFSITKTFRLAKILTLAW